MHKGEPIDGIDCGDEAAAWFSRVLLDKGCGLRLAHHDAQFKRDIEHVHQKVLPAFPKLTNESAVSIFALFQTKKLKRYFISRECFPI